MALPDIPEIREVLSALSLSPRKGSGDTSAVQIAFRPAVDQTGWVGQESPLWLHHSTTTTIPFNRLVQRINKELEAAGHSGNEGFGLFALALSMLARQKNTDRVSGVNGILAAITSSDVNLYFSLAAELPERFRFEMPPFRVGPLRLEKLKYNCEKARSDYFSRYENLLRDSWAVERAPRKVRVFDIPVIRKSVFGSPLNISSHEDWEVRAWESIVEGYFSLQNSFLFEEFWGELSSVQTPLIALGAPFFDGRGLSSFIHSQQIAVFLNLGQDNEGFVAPAGSGPQFVKLELANAHERIPKAVKELEESYQFKQFDDSALHKSIRIYAEFVARAIRHDIEGRLNEAFLHFVIACSFSTFFWIGSAARQLA